MFEDLHAAEPLLLDLIERLMRDGRRLPLLVVCVARWGFLDERPGWAGGLADAVTLWVEPLATEDAVQLAMEAGDLGRDDALRVAEHAGGNPLFIVEITGMLLREEDVLPPTAPLRRPRPLPPTVQAVIASRIDSLSPAARDLIRKASVFARGAFDASELSLVAEPRKDVMAELEDAEFLVPESTGRGRTRGGSGARCCATSRTRAWPSASVSACTCAREPPVGARQRRAVPTHDRVPPGAGGERRRWI